MSTTISTAQPVTVIKVQHNLTTIKSVQESTVVKAVQNLTTVKNVASDTVIKFSTQLPSLSGFEDLFLQYLNSLPVADSDEDSGLPQGGIYITSSSHVQAPGGLIKRVE